MMIRLLYLFNRLLDKRDDLVDHWDDQTNLSKIIYGLFATIMILFVTIAVAQMLTMNGDGSEAPAMEIPASIEEPEESIVKEPATPIQKPEEPELVPEDLEPEVVEPTVPKTTTPSEEPVETPPVKTQEPYREYTVTIEGNLTFQPNTINVNVGDVVVWKNNDFWGLKTFPIYSDDELWDVMNVAYNESVSYAFTYPGHFKYHSYAGMEGEVVVVQT